MHTLILAYLTIIIGQILVTNLETVSSSQRKEKSVVSKKVQPLILKASKLKNLGNQYSTIQFKPDPV